MRIWKDLQIIIIIIILVVHVLGRKETRKSHDDISARVRASIGGVAFPEDPSIKAIITGEVVFGECGDVCRYKWFHELDGDLVEDRVRGC
jgi:hypothetical protein